MGTRSLVRSFAVLFSCVLFENKGTGEGKGGDGTLSFIHSAAPYSN